MALASSGEEVEQLQRRLEMTAVMAMSRRIFLLVFSVAGGPGFSALRAPEDAGQFSKGKF